jgi:hypothetical protein
LVLVELIASDWNAFLAFVRNADPADAGQVLRG